MPLVGRTRRQGLALVLIYKRNDRLHEAVAEYRKALVLRPDFAEAHGAGLDVPAAGLRIRRARRLQKPAHPQGWQSMIGPRQAVPILIAERILQRKLQFYNNSPAMERGLMVEAEAVDWYEFDQNVAVQKSRLHHR